MVRRRRVDNVLELYDVLNGTERMLLHAELSKHYWWRITHALLLAVMIITFLGERTFDYGDEIWISHGGY